MNSNLNVSAFARANFTNPDGTLSRDGLRLMLAWQAIFGVTGIIPASSVSFTPAGGISSVNVQAAIEELDTEKQPKDATLTALAALATVADELIYATGVDTFALATLTAYARSLLDDPDAATARTTLGLGTLATQNGTFSGTSSGTNTGDQFTAETVSTLIGRGSAGGVGAAQEITLGTGLSMAVTTLTVAPQYQRRFLLMGG